MLASMYVCVCMHHLDGYLCKQSPEASVEVTNESTTTDQPSEAGTEQQPPTNKPVQSRFKPAARPAPRFTASNIPKQVSQRNMSSSG